MPCIQGIFPTQGLNPGLPHCRRILYQLSHKGSPTYSRHLCLIYLAQLVKNPPAMQETQFDSWVGKIRRRRDRLPIPVFLDFPGGSAGKESACNAGDLGLIPGLGRSPGEGKGYPLQSSGLQNSVDTVHAVAKSQTQLNDFHFPFSALLAFSEQFS